MGHHSTRQAIRSCSSTTPALDVFNALTVSTGGDQLGTVSGKSTVGPNAPTERLNAPCRARGVGHPDGRLAAACRDRGGAARVGGAHVTGKVLLGTIQVVHHIGEQRLGRRALLGSLDGGIDHAGLTLAIRGTSCGGCNLDRSWSPRCQPMYRYGMHQNCNQATNEVSELMWRWTPRWIAGCLYPSPPAHPRRSSPRDHRQSRPWTWPASDCDQRA